MNKQWITIGALLVVIVLGGLGAVQYVKELQRDDKSYKMSYTGAATPISNKVCVSPELFFAIDGLKDAVEGYNNYLTNNTTKDLNEFMELNYDVIDAVNKLIDTSSTSVDDPEYKVKALRIAQNVSDDSYKIIKHIQDGTVSKQDAANSMISIGWHADDLKELRKSIQSCNEGL